MPGIAERIQLMLSGRPFRPFTIHTSDGQVIMVKDSRFAWLHPYGRTMYVCADPNVDAEEVINVSHVTKLSKGGRQSHNRRNK